MIPAHPLALTAERKLDERRQRALTRYYLDAGAGGIAVGVHTTQFAIRNPKLGLYRAGARAGGGDGRASAERRRQRAGRCASPASSADTPGRGGSASSPRRSAIDVGLLSLGALARRDGRALVAHCRAVAEVIPLFGFYLQPAVGGRVLSYRFWRAFAEIEDVVAIKIAPFNRYRTLDVVRRRGRRRTGARHRAVHRQ